MSEFDHPESFPPRQELPVVMKGVPVAGQAEKLIRVRREITHADELTRIEQIEDEAHRKAEAALGKARAEADQLVASARADAQSIRTKARNDGDLGAKREALQKLAGLITELEREIEMLRAVRSEFLNSNLEGILEFSCSLARKILVCELHTRPKIIAARARMLLERMPPGAGVTLTVSPDDLDVIQSYLHEAGGPTDTLLPVLRSDPALETGCLRLESDSGRIDAGLLNVLDELGSLLSDQAVNLAQNGNPAREGQNGG